MLSSAQQKFERVYLEISNICNLQCTFCPVVERDNKICQVEEFKKYAAQAAPLAKQVCLHLMGEPLAHPKFNEVMQVCDELGLRIFLTTNGTLIKKYHQQLLQWKSLDQINFSIHSFFANPARQSLEDYLEPILQFTRDLEQQSPNVYVNLRLWNQATHNEVRQQNHLVLDRIESFFSLAINRSIDVQSIKSKKLFGRTYLHFDTEFGWPSLNNPKRSETGFCHALTKQVAVHADGTVVPCCLDKEAKIPLGNLNSQSLNEILSSPRAQAMKNGFKKNQLVEELCQKCPYISRFD